MASVPPCPPAPPPPIGGAVCYSSGHAAACSGGNLPNGPLDPCVPCAAPRAYPDACPNDYCGLSVLARVIVCVVRLADPDGASNTDIMTYHNDVLCPQQALSVPDVDRVVRTGIHRGALVRVPEGRVKVYGFFGDMPSNLGLRQELGADYQLCLGMFCGR